MSARKLERDIWSSREKPRSTIHNIEKPQSQGNGEDHPERVYGRAGIGPHGTFKDWPRMRNLRKSKKRPRRENKAGSEGHPTSQCLWPS